MRPLTIILLAALLAGCESQPQFKPTDRVIDLEFPHFPCYIAAKGKTMEGVVEDYYSVYYTRPGGRYLGCRTVHVSKLKKYEL